jgi:hypothetical protein
MVVLVEVGDPNIEFDATPSPYRYGCFYFSSLGRLTQPYCSAGLAQYLK